MRPNTVSLVSIITHDIRIRIILLNKTLYTQSRMRSILYTQRRMRSIQYKTIHILKRKETIHILKRNNEQQCILQVVHKNPSIILPL